ncbi:FG-GAP repeat domain-containing protein [Streptomyces vietnamensis]|uniref:FG-GAP repeat domain-containing protein n=1 Tax=Streptomyces vietnamensis TaxID=362257 RepID=UPI00069851C3|nr:VCBS repeat-containing protein [Streptomyces vietnamensis]
MLHVHTGRTRLVAAVTAVLAVTAVTGLAAPAFATGPTAPAPALTAVSDSQDTLTIPAGSQLLSSGRTGVLSVTEGASTVHRWTRFSDGVTTTLPAGERWGVPGTDTVATQNGSVYTLTDMSGASEPVVIDTSAFNTAATPYSFVRVVGSTLVMRKSTPDGMEFHLVSEEDGHAVDHEIVLPEGARPLLSYSNGPGTLALQYVRSMSNVRTLGVVDLATGAITDTHDVPVATVIASVVVSPTHVAWTERPVEAKSFLAVARRDGTTVERTLLDDRTDTELIRLGAVGDWVTYDRDGGGTATLPLALHALTARSLNTGETVKLLDHVQSGTVGADGGLLALGGTVEHGEGLYRVAPGADGTPVATLVAGTGRPTALTVEKETLPPSGVVDFDHNGGALNASWTLSRSNTTVSLVFTHTASGLTGGEAYTDPHAGLTDFPFTWDGTFSNGLPAYNGDYTWTMTAKPANGIGPDVVRTGTFTLTRAPRPHDFDDNGSPDVLSRDGAGRLRSYDLRQIEGSSPTQKPDPVDLGTGWYAYDRITATGDIAGTTAGDVVTRDTTGVLWLHQGNGKGLGPRTKIGSGWQIYTKLTAGSDLTGDGRPDLLATDTSGVLWLYKATGDAVKPFEARVQIGAGWGIYNQLTAVGDLAGAAAGDLVARDTSGVLWLYLGKGDGTFASRTKIGSGWSQYSSLVGVGDTDRDGRNDLVAYDDSHSDLYVYKGTGDWQAPFASRRALYNPGLGDGVTELF